MARQLQMHHETKLLGVTGFDSDVDDTESSTRSWDEEDASSVEDEAFAVQEFTQDSPLNDFTLPCWAELDRLDLTNEFSQPCATIKQIPLDVSPCLKRFVEQLCWALQESPEGSQARERAWKVMQLRDRLLLAAPCEALSLRSLDVSSMIRNRMAALASGQWQELLEQARSFQGVKQLNGGAKTCKTPRIGSQQKPTFAKFMSQKSVHFLTFLKPRSHNMTCSTHNITSPSAPSFTQPLSSTEQRVSLSSFRLGETKTFQCSWSFARGASLVFLLVLAMTFTWGWCVMNRPRTLEVPNSRLENITWDAKGGAWQLSDEHGYVLHEADPAANVQAAFSKSEDVDEKIKELNDLIGTDQGNAQLALEDHDLKQFRHKVDTRLLELEHLLHHTDQIHAQAPIPCNIESQTESAGTGSTAWLLLSCVIAIAAVQEVTQKWFGRNEKHRVPIVTDSLHTDGSTQHSNSESTAMAASVVPSSRAASNAHVGETVGVPQSIHASRSLGGSLYLRHQELPADVASNPCRLEHQVTPASATVGVVTPGAATGLGCRHEELGAPVPTASSQPQEALTDSASSLHQTKLRVTAASAVVGAVTTGAAGGIGGGIVGTALGASIGIVPAFFTFGLSIPFFAGLGGAVGGCTGTCVGGTVGAVGGGVAGYGAYTCTETVSCRVSRSLCE